jgi:uncharacterized membrane protein YfcA
MELSILLLLGLASFIAGVIDTIAGGGGLIVLPALLFSGLSPIQALGTGKLQGSICGLASVLHFKKGGHIDYSPIYRYLFYICAGAMIGVAAVEYIRVEYLEKLIPFMLLGVFIYFLLPIGKHIKPHSHEDLRKLKVLGPIIGFYDGFFGPGTGSIWTIVSVRMMNLTIKHAIMYAKLFNLVGSVTALICFLISGSVHIAAAIAMGIGAYLGGVVGARLVVYKDVSIVRIVLSILMLSSILGTFYKYYF